MKEGKFIDFRRTGGRADIILKRPPRNVLDGQMLEEMVTALEPLRDDETLKALVIRGSGGNFCGGIELLELTTENVGLFMPNYTRLFDIINGIRGVVIAGIKGEAFSAGCEIACFADVTIAGKSAKFCFPDIKIGLFPPIATAVLPRLVGRNRSFDWIFSSRLISAEEALSHNLISRLVPDDQLEAFVEEYAARILSLSGAAIICAKRALDSALYVPVMEGLKKTESTYMIDLMNSIDPHEGIKAAIEGRTPVWRNR